MIQELCDQEATMDKVKEKLEEEHDYKWGESDSIETSETMNHMMKDKKRSNPKRLTSWTMNSMQMIFMEKKTYHFCNKCESKKRLMIMTQQQLKTEMGSGIWTLLRRKECHDQMVMKAMSSKGFGAQHHTHELVSYSPWSARKGRLDSGNFFLEPLWTAAALLSLVCWVFLCCMNLSSFVSMFRSTTLFIPSSILLREEFVALCSFMYTMPAPEACSLYPYW